MIAAKQSPADPILLGVLSLTQPIDAQARPVSCELEQSFDVAMEVALSKDGPVSPGKDAAEVADAVEAVVLAPPAVESNSAPEARPVPRAKAGNVSLSRTHHDFTRPSAADDGRNAQTELDTTEASASGPSPEMAAGKSLDDAPSEDTKSEQPLPATASHVNVPIPSMALNMMLGQMLAPVAPMVAIRPELNPPSPAPPVDKGNAEARPVSLERAGTDFVTPGPAAVLPSPGTTAMTLTPLATAREAGASRSRADGATAMTFAPIATAREVEASRDCTDGTTAMTLAPLATAREAGASRSRADGATAVSLAPMAMPVSSTVSVPTETRTAETPMEAKPLVPALEPAPTVPAQTENVPLGQVPELVLSAAPPPSPTAMSVSTLPPSPAPPSKDVLSAALLPLTWAGERPHESSPQKVVFASATIPVTGMAGAKSSPEMKKAEETSRANTAPEQLLPASPALAARPDAEPALASSQRTLSSVREFEKHRTPVTPSENILVAPTGRMDVPDDGEAMTVSVTSAPGAAPAMVQAHHKISACALELKQVKADSMSVMLRPDADTEVVLNLRLRDGLVDVAAQVKRGDGTGLSAHWGELQQTLSSQGIRLGSLETWSSPSVNGQHPEDGFTRSNRHSPERENSGKPFEWEELSVPARSPAKVKLGAQAPAAKRLWETWA